MYFKSITANLCLRGLEFKLDTVTYDCKRFLADVPCDNGIHFTDATGLLVWACALDHTHYCRVQVPENAQLYVYPDGPTQLSSVRKAKTDRILLLDHQPLGGFVDAHLPAIADRLHVLSLCGDAIQYFSEEARRPLSVRLAAVRNWPHSIRFLQPHERQELELRREAIAVSQGEAIQHLYPEERSEEEIRLQMLQVCSREQLDKYLTVIEKKELNI